MPTVSVKYRQLATLNGVPVQRNLCPDCGGVRTPAAAPAKPAAPVRPAAPAAPAAKPYRPLDSWGLGNSQLGNALANAPAAVAALPVAPAYPNHAMRDSWNVRGTQLGRDLGVR